MALRTGLSGLNAASTDLNVLGNNVANANTVGFKKSGARFADSYAAALAGSSATQVGIGTQVSNVTQLFNQGTVTPTDNPLDLAINGSGFFRLDDNGSTVYSRNGQFSVDKSGYIVNDAGAKLTGYLASAGAITGSLGNLQIDQADISPTPTANIEVGLNLPAAATAKNPALFDADNPATYNHSTSVTVYDTLGTAHLATVYFIKDSASVASPKNWVVNYKFDSASAGTTPGSGTLTTLGFDGSGNITSGGTPSLAMTAWSTTPTGGTIAFDLSTSTLYDSPFGVNRLLADGNASGRLSGININGDGNIYARYTNGQAQTIGQVTLSNFNSPDGLQATGNNLWVETFQSGSPLTGAPGTSSLGVLQSGAVEASNVDLTEELVNMITAQRTYQANAQTIKTEDQLLQTLLSLR